MRTGPILTIEDKDVGMRLDKCIALKLGEGYSRTYVKTLIDSGFIRVNEKTIKPRYIVQRGDEVLIEFPPQKKEEEIEPENIPLKILYEDDWIIVIDKPAGMVVHPGAGNKKGTLVNALLYHTREIAKVGEALRPGIVHRLDKDTSGVIVVAKNGRALRSLSKQFQKRAVKKSYIALVQGRVEMDNGIIEAPVTRHITDRKKMDIGYTKGKPSRTIYHVLKRFKDFTVVRLEPETGRTHQIRVHMKHLGYPLLGDVKYGHGERLSRHALHAEKIVFTHPDTGKRMEFSSPLAEDMKRFIEEASSEDTP